MEFVMVINKKQTKISTEEISDNTFIACVDKMAASIDIKLHEFDEKVKAAQHLIDNSKSLRADIEAEKDLYIPPIYKQNKKLQEVDRGNGKIKKNSDDLDKEIEEFEKKVEQSLGIEGKLPTREQNQELTRIMEAKYPHMDFCYI